MIPKKHFGLAMAIALMSTSNLNALEVSVVNKNSTDLNMNSKFEDIIHRIDSLADAINQLNGKITNNASEISDLKVKDNQHDDAFTQKDVEIADLYQQLEDISTRVQNNTTNTNTNTNEITSIRTALNANTNQTNNNTTRITILESGLKGVIENTDNLEDNLNNSNNADLGNLEAQVLANKTNIEKNRVDLNTTKGVVNNNTLMNNHQNLMMQAQTKTINGVVNTMTAMSTKVNTNASNITSAKTTIGSNSNRISVLENAKPPTSGGSSTTKQSYWRSTGGSKTFGPGSQSPSTISLGSKCSSLNEYGYYGVTTTSCGSSCQQYRASIAVCQY